MRFKWIPGKSRGDLQITLGHTRMDLISDQRPEQPIKVSEAKIQKY